MKSMYSARAWKLVAIVGILAGLLVAGTALAVTVDRAETPDTAEIGSPAEATIVLTNPYEDADNWRLIGETEMRNASWTVDYFNQGGDNFRTTEVEGQTFNGEGITLDDSVDRIRIVVQGDAPAPEEFDYENPSQFTILELAQQPEGGTPSRIDAWETHPYTPASQSARQAIDEAKAAIDEAEAEGVDVSSARNEYQDAIQAFDGGEFELAQSNAEQAQQAAEDAQSQASAQSQQMQLIIFGVGAVVLIGLVGGGIYYYRQQQKKDTRLR